MVAQFTDLKPGEFIWTGVDCHLYTNHIDLVDEQLTRTPRSLPRMPLNPAVTDIDAFTFEDFRVEGYEPLPHIKADVAV